MAGDTLLKTSPRFRRNKNLPRSTEHLVHTDNISQRNTRKSKVYTAMVHRLLPSPCLWRGSCCKKSFRDFPKKWAFPHLNRNSVSLHTCSLFLPVLSCEQMIVRNCKSISVILASKSIHIIKICSSKEQFSVSSTISSEYEENRSRSVLVARFTI